MVKTLTLALITWAIFALLFLALAVSPASGAELPRHEVSDASALRWLPGGRPDTWRLHSGPYQIGFLDEEGRYYPRLTSGEWGPESIPPLSPPSFGVVGARISATPRITRGGNEITRAEGVRALTASVPDDRTKLRLTVIGPEPSRAKVLADLGAVPALTAHQSAYVLQSYAPDDPLIAGFGFVTTGQPTIYLQDPTGKVLYRGDSYDSPDKLIAALRAADPNYQPAKDPDGSAPASSTIPLPALALAGLGVSLLILGGIRK